MTANTPKTVVVEIDGLWFRFQRFRARRSGRGLAKLGWLLGASMVELIVGKAFAALVEVGQLEVFGKMLSAANMTGGHATNPDEFEKGFNELCAYTAANGGEGVSLSPEPLDADSKGWQPLRNMASLDAFDGADHLMILAIFWEVIKLNYRPTSAAAGTSPDTAPAVATSTTTKSPGGATAGSGSQTTPTPTVTGISGG